MDAAALKQFVRQRLSNPWKKPEPLTEENWYSQAASACEAVSDAILIENKGSSARLVKTVTGKLGVAGATAGMFSIASLFGAASTGTAIGSLSGAAFHSAALAWLGGSVAVGATIVGGIGVATAIGAVFGVQKYFVGRKRKKDSLDEQERRIVDACIGLAISFREQEKLQQTLVPICARALHNDALAPLKAELAGCVAKSADWPPVAQWRLISALRNLEKVAAFLQTPSLRLPAVTTGIVSAVILQLLAQETPNFNKNEELVLDALCRSNNSLTQASTGELSSYVQNLAPGQIGGLTNNVKGIYHELLYQRNENSDGDEYTVELFPETNHPGADIIRLNTLTNEAKEIQLKATNYLSYIQSHNEKYPTIPAFATTEVATACGIPDTGISNVEITNEVSGVLGALDQAGTADALESMSLAAMITLARNTKVLLKGNNATYQEKRQMLEDGMISAGVAGLVNLVI